MILDANNSPRLDRLDFERNLGPFARPDISTGVGDKIDHELHEGARIHVEAFRFLGHPHFKVELMSASDKSDGTSDERPDLCCLRMNGKVSALDLCRRQPVAHDVIEMIKVGVERLEFLGVARGLSHEIDLKPASRHRRLEFMSNNADQIILHALHFLALRDIPTDDAEALGKRRTSCPEGKGSAFPRLHCAVKLRLVDGDILFPRLKLSATESQHLMLERPGHHRGRGGVFKLRPPLRVEKNDPVLHVLENLPEETLLSIELRFTPYNRARQMDILLLQRNLPCMQSLAQLAICGLHFAKFLRSLLNRVPVVPVVLINVSPELPKSV